MNVLYSLFTTYTNTLIKPRKIPHLYVKVIDQMARTFQEIDRASNNLEKEQNNCNFLVYCCCGTKKCASIWATIFMEQVTGICY